MDELEFEHFDNASKSPTFLTGVDATNKINNFFDQVLSELGVNTNSGIRFVVVTHIVRNLVYYLRAIRKAGPIAALIPKGKSRIEHLENTLFYPEAQKWYSKIFREDAHREYLAEYNNAHDFLSGLIHGNSPEIKLVIIDEGGYFAPFVEALANKPDAPLQGKIVSICEFTKNGYNQYKKLFDTETFRSGNKIHISSIAVSSIKQACDNEVGVAIVRELNNILVSDLNARLNDHSIAVLGCGVVGKAVIKALGNNSNENLYLYDIQPEYSDEASRLPNHRRNTTVLSSKQSLIDARPDILICATGSAKLGTPSIEKTDMESLQNNTIIACVTSREDEFAVNALEDYEDISKTGAVKSKYFNSYKHKHLHPEKIVNLALNGDAVNFISNSLVGPAIYSVMAAALIDSLRYNDSSRANQTHEFHEIKTQDIAIIRAIHQRIFTEEYRIANVFGLFDEPKFFGRRNQLNDLYNQLENNRMGIIIAQGGLSQINNTPQEAISGLRGVGKSRLAREYARQSIEQGRYDYVIYLSCCDAVAMWNSYSQLATALGIHQPEKYETRALIEKIKTCLRSYQKILVIYDDVQKPENINHVIMGDDFIDFRLSFESHDTIVHSIVTTTNQLYHTSPEHKILLGNFTPDESREYITYYLSNNTQLSQEKVDLLANTLHHFPLALSQAVAYLANERQDLLSSYVSFTMDELIDSYVNNFNSDPLAQENLLNAPGTPEELYRNTVYITVNLTLRKIENSNPRGVELLAQLAYFSTAAISHKFLDCYFGIDNTLRQGVINSLKQFSLIEEKTGSQTYLLVHGLVQDVIRLVYRNRERDYIALALNLVFNTAFTEVNNISLDLIDHCIKVINFHENNAELQEFEKPKKIELLRALGSYQHYNAFLSEQARDHLNRAQDIVARNTRAIDPAQIIQLTLTMANVEAGAGNPMGFVQAIQQLGEIEDLSVQSHILPILQSHDIDIPPLFLPFAESFIQNIPRENRVVAISNFLNNNFGVYELAIALVMFNGNMATAREMAKARKQQYQTNNDKDRVKSLCLWFETCFFGGYINEALSSINELIAVHTIIKNSAENSGIAFWQDQVSFMLSVMHNMRNEYRQSTEVIFWLWNRMVKNAAGLEGLKSRAICLERLIDGFMSNHPNTDNDRTTSWNMYAQGYALLGRLFTALGNGEANYTDAHRCFEKALRHDANSPVINYQYAFARLHSRLLDDDTIIHLERARESDRDYLHKPHELSAVSNFFSGSEAEESMAERFRNIATDRTAYSIKLLALSFLALIYFKKGGSHYKIAFNYLQLLRATELNYPLSQQMRAVIVDNYHHFFQTQTLPATTPNYLMPQTDI